MHFVVECDLFPAYFSGWTSLVGGYALATGRRLSDYGG
jgi:hypothetical protein